jgi:serine/threonine-protein kinase
VLGPGDVIDGKYRVLRPLGEGGMGAVFEGENLRLKRRVAIKVMHAAMARERKLVMRFEREAQAAANVASRHVVDVFDLGDLPTGDRYMVMEFLDGQSLQARLKERSRLPPPEIAAVAVQLLEGLARVHQAGIIHRDLKPPNIFLARAEGGDEIVKILDFGICKMNDRDRPRGDVSTGVGDVLGTLAYMSPEQLEHGSRGLDARADLYAVGVMLYRSVTGALPYGSSSVVDLLRELREGRAPRIGDLAGDVDPRFSAIVHKALEWDRSARFATARDFQRALGDWLKGLSRIEEVLSDFLEAPLSSGASRRARAESAEPGAALGRVALVSPASKRAPKKTLKMADAPALPSETPDGIEVDVDLDADGDADD